MSLQYQIVKHKNFQRLLFVFILQAKLETKALKAKRPGFTDDRYSETSYYVENGKFHLYKTLSA